MKPEELPKRQLCPIYSFRKSFSRYQVLWGSRRSLYLGICTFSFPKKGLLLTESIYSLISLLNAKFVLDSFPFPPVVFS